jgi:hypothetical protein
MALGEDGSLQLVLSLQARIKPNKRPTGRPTHSVMEWARRNQSAQPVRMGLRKASTSSAFERPAFAGPRTWKFIHEVEQKERSADMSSTTQLTQKGRPQAAQRPVEGESGWAADPAVIAD